MRVIAPATFIAAALLAATPAVAQDNRPAWQGFHVEGLAGLDHTIGQHGGGVVYGMGVGYDVKAGRAVLGIDAEATDSSYRGCMTAVIVATDRLCASPGRELSIGLRAGILVSPNVLLYAKGGYTNARFHVDYDDGTPAGTNNFNFSQNLDGFRVGGGAELKVGRQAFIRVEGRYSNYKQASGRGQAIAAFGFRF